MQKYHRDIILCKKIEGEIIWHDPLYENVEYDPIRDIWGLDINSPPKAFMHFARPIQICVKQWDSVSDGWDCVFIEDYESYYRPSEFYDHYYSSDEIENLKNKDLFIRTLLSYCKIMAYAMKNINENSYKSHIAILEIMIKQDSTYIEAVHHYLDTSKYRIVKNIPSSSKFLDIPFYGNLRKNHFDETWNTVDYFHLLLPKSRTYFLNPEKLTCTCKEFKKTKKCTHLLESSIKRVLYSLCENTQLVADLTPNVLKYCI
jgi:hypothetical protein